MVLLLAAGCRPVLRSPADAPDEDPTAQWGELLGRVVTDDGYVDYDRLEAERGALDTYVAWIGRYRALPEPRWERLAFWLNAYNALTLFAVLEDGRPASVMDVDGWLPVAGAGFFFERAFSVPRGWVSLYELEHHKLRGRYLDYRIHAAINCASTSCPPLRAELYTVPGLDRQLERQMGVWVEDSDRGLYIEEDGTVVFSALFDWYDFDFVEWTGGRDPCRVAADHARGKRKEALTAASEAGCPHRYMDYDWSLNHRPFTAP